MKHLTEFCETKIREKKTDPAFQFLLQEYSKLNDSTPISFDKLVAKLCMRFYCTAGVNYDQDKGQIFTKVTLEMYRELSTSKIVSSSMS